MSNAITRRSAPLFTGHSSGPHGLFAAVLRLPMAVLDLLIAWQQRYEERLELSELSGRQRRDVGLSDERLQAMVGKLHWSR